MKYARTRFILIRDRARWLKPDAPESLGAKIPLSSVPDIEKKLALETGKVSLWSKVFFLVSMCGFLATAVGMVLEKNQGWALLVAAFACVLLWYLERGAGKQNSDSSAIANKKLQLNATIGSIVLFTFVVCLPTLKTWFLTDDFAMVHSAYHFTPAAFLQLLHMDSSQFVRGEARQEFRPLYSLFYAVAFRIWGLQAWGYHVCQIALHATVAVLVFLTAKAVAPGK